MTPGNPVEAALEDISQLLGIYADAVDHREARAVAQLFVEDAVLIAPGITSREGRDAIEEHYHAFVVDGLRRRGVHMRHRVSSPHAWRTGPLTADAHSFFDVDVVFDGPQAEPVFGARVSEPSVVTNSGRYKASLHSSDGTWLFSRLAVIGLWVTVLPASNIAVNDGENV